ncbi:MAG: class I SAM-dependent methyltransferase [Thermomicrobiales bacterium]
MSEQRHEQATSSPSVDLREWDAASYHKVANPHVDWGRAVVDRVPLRGEPGEVVVDIGCGTGRLTELLLERWPALEVIAIDQSANMVAQAEAHLRPRFGDRVRTAQANALQLVNSSGGVLGEASVDAAFSTATFHWITDHPALFAEIFRLLKPGGWLIAQCGGGSNIARLEARAMGILRQDPFAPFIGDWNGPWHFADGPVTEARMREAGFTNVAAETFAAPVTMPDAEAYREFLATVVFGTHLNRLPDDDPTLRAAFIERMVAAGATDEPPFSLDYWRLNLMGQRPEG